MRRKYTIIAALLAVILSIAFITHAGPVFAEDFSFAAACDGRGDGDKAGESVNEPVMTALFGDMVENHPEVEFLIFPGDMVHGSRKEPAQTLIQLEYWKKVMAPVYNNPRMVWPRIWPSAGNHELKTAQAEKDFLTAFPDVYFNGPEGEKGYTYSFDHKGVHFVGLMTNHFAPEDDSKPKPYYIREKTLQWLDGDLRAARKRGVKHIFVFGHQPAFPIGRHITDGLPQAGWILKNPDDPDSSRFLKMRDRFWNILKAHKVTAYISGHEHCYGRQSVQGVYQIVTGGAGAELRGLNPTQKEDSPYNEKNLRTYKQVLPYYKILGYPHGPDDKCQASDDFVGGRFYHYMVFQVEDAKITVRTYGFDPKDGDDSSESNEYRVILKDEFVIGK